MWSPRRSARHVAITAAAGDHRELRRVVGPRGQPLLIADIHGDWREEVVMRNSSSNELIIFTTDRPTDHRLYTLAHNPAYRNDMTVKGYLQSGNVDYFLGNGMAQPQRSDIAYTG